MAVQAERARDFSEQQLLRVSASLTRQAAEAYESSLPEVGDAKLRAALLVADRRATINTALKLLAEELRVYGIENVEQDRPSGNGVVKLEFQPEPAVETTSVSLPPAETVIPEVKAENPYGKLWRGKGAKPKVLFAIGKAVFAAGDGKLRHTTKKEIFEVLSKSSHLFDTQRTILYDKMNQFGEEECIAIFPELEVGLQIVRRDNPEVPFADCLRVLMYTRFNQEMAPLRAPNDGAVTAENPFGKFWNGHSPKPHQMFNTAKAVFLLDSDGAFVYTSKEEIIEAAKLNSSNFGTSRWRLESKMISLGEADCVSSIPGLDKCLAIMRRDDPEKPFAECLQILLYTRFNQEETVSERATPEASPANGKADGQETPPVGSEQTRTVYTAEPSVPETAPPSQAEVPISSPHVQKKETERPYLLAIEAHYLRSLLRLNSSGMPGFTYTTRQEAWFVVNQARTVNMSGVQLADFKETLKVEGDEVYESLLSLLRRAALDPDHLNNTIQKTLNHATHEADVYKGKGIDTFIRVVERKLSYDDLTMQADKPLLPTPSAAAHPVAPEPNGAESPEKTHQLELNDRLMLLLARSLRTMDKITGESAGVTVLRSTAGVLYSHEGRLHTALGKPQLSTGDMGELVRVLRAMQKQDQGIITNFGEVLTSTQIQEILDVIKDTGEPLFNVLLSQKMKQMVGLKDLQEVASVR